MNLIKVGIVGAVRGSWHIMSFGAHDDVEVTALCDINETSLNARADRHGVPKRYTDYRELLESDVDIVVVATPMQLHVPQSLEALAAGKHVLSEVTAAVSVDQCKELLAGVEQAKASGLKYMMAENFCYLDETVALQNMVDQGLFGDIYLAEAEYVHDLHYLQTELDGSPSWRTSWQVGVNGCSYATHQLGPALEWFGKDARVQSLVCMGSGHHVMPQFVQEDSTFMLCKLNTGGLIRVRVDMLSRRPHEMSYFSLQGTRGCFESARGLGDRHKIWLDSFGVRAPDPHTHADPYDWRPFAELQQRHMPDDMELPEGYLETGAAKPDYFVAREMVRAIREDRQPLVDIYKALDYTLPGLLSEQSISNGGAPVKVPDFRSGEWS